VSSPAVTERDVIVCSVPAEGHVRPMLGVARGLLARGWRVRFLTGRRFAAEVTESGADFLPLPADADTLDQLDRSKRRAGLAVLNEEMRLAFLDPAPGQARALLEAIGERPADAVLADTLFLGAAALQSLELRNRPLHVTCGITPLGLADDDVAPMGLGLTPMRGPIGRLRNRMLYALATKVLLKPAHQAADETLKSLGAKGLEGRFLTNGLRNADLIAQLSVPAFEYPLRDTPDNLVFVGPMSRAKRPGAAPVVPDEPPLIHVTQGTQANIDFSELIGPALEALADEPVQVLVTAGGRPIDTLPPLPANARAEQFLDYGEVLPRCRAFVTNGGYGGLLAALEHGLPIVVAGDTEDKKETSARVAWSGTGISLRTGHPKPEAIRRAVRRVLADPAYADRSRRIGAEIDSSGGAEALVTEIDRRITDRRRHLDTV
jgi:MGT family glycosyltransferase